MRPTIPYQNSTMSIFRAKTISGLWKIIHLSIKHEAHFGHLSYKTRTITEKRKPTMHKFLWTKVVKGF